MNITTIYDIMKSVIGEMTVNADVSTDFNTKSFVAIMTNGAPGINEYWYAPHFTQFNNMFKYLSSTFAYKVTDDEKKEFIDMINSKNDNSAYAFDCETNNGVQVFVFNVIKDNEMLPMFVIPTCFNK